MADPRSILTDPARLRILREAALVDSGPEEPFEGIIRLAAGLLDVPIVLITIVDENRQYFKSFVGLGEPWATQRETPLSHSFCKHVVMSGERLVVSDARLHPLVRDNLAITDMGILAYAGMPVTRRSGERLGTFAAADLKPRQWSERELWVLEQLASLVLNEVEARLVARAREQELQELHRQEESVRALTEHAPDVIARYDRNLRHLYINPVIEKITGHPPAHFLGRTNSEIGLTQKAAALWEARLRQVFETGRGTEFEFEYDKDGGRCYLQTRLVPEFDREGHVQFVLEVTRDISAMKRIEHELRESEQRLSLAQTGAAQGVWDWHLPSGSMYLSPELERLLGYEPGELEHHADTWQRLCHPDDYAAAAAELEASIGSGSQNHSLTYRLRTKSNEWRWYMDQGTVVERDERGAAVRLVGVIKDVTQQRRLEDELRQAQKMEAVGHLAGGVAHDFNNLLTSIIGYAEILKLELGDAADVAGSLEEIEKAALRAATLTRQLLAFSRKQLLSPRVLDLNGTVRGTFGMLRRLVREDVALELELDESIGHVRADPNQLQQVLLNLVVNASQAVERDGGRVVIATSDREVVEADRERHAFLQPGSFISVRVSDNGSGIPAHVLPHIFDPFFTTKPVGQGTGLGLSTVYGIMKQSGGYVLVESTQGEGTTFEILLPRIAPETADEAIAAGTRQPGRGQERVLLVEDDAQVRAVARRSLERAGYRVAEAIDGTDALQLIDSGAVHPDVLVTDLVMPGVGGLRLADRLRTRIPGLRVVFISGYTGDDLTAERHLHPDAVFVQKPFSPEALEAAVRKALD